MFEAQVMLLGVVGNPIAHSRSPQIHHFFARQLGWYIEYKRIFSDKTQFATVTQRFFNGGGTGLNITLPFKAEAAMLATELSTRAQLVGVVNTLKRTEHGIYGDTTDGQGFIDDVQRLSVQDPFRATVVILGAGGAIRGLLPDIVLQDPPRLIILNRTAAKAQALAQEVQGWQARLGFTTEIIGAGLDYCAAEQQEISLLVQGTSGFAAQDQQWLSWLGSLSQTMCYDLNYGERAQHFCEWAALREAVQIHDGLGMLVGQAAASFALWTGEMPSVGATMSYLKVVNPWLEDWWQPPFNAIGTQVAISQLRDAIIARLQAKESVFDQRLNEIDSGQIPLTWDSLIRCYEALNDNLMCVWSVLKHLNSVSADEDVRSAYSQLQPSIEAHFAWERQHPLYKTMVDQLMRSRSYAQFSKAQKTYCEKILQKCALSGFELPLEKQQQLNQCTSEIARLGQEYADLVMDATHDWSLDVTEDELVGMPAHLLSNAKDDYEQANPQSGQYLCRLTLQEPTVKAVLRFCEVQQTRHAVYEAKVTLASDQGPQSGLYDTSWTLKEILALRHQQAKILGFEHYAALSCVDNMAQTPESAVELLELVLQDVKPKAQAEHDALCHFARQELEFDTLQPWDVAFVAEKRQQAQLSLDAQALAQYFPVASVLKGLFHFVHQFFKLSCRIDYAVPTYQEDVRFIEFSNGDTVIGGLFLDLYARPGKQSGAWSDACRQRYMTAEGRVSLPIAYLVCNFVPPGERPTSLLTQDDIAVLFHQMGHCLHQILSEIDVAGVSGVDNIECDAMQIAGYLLECWCYRHEILPSLSAHVVSGRQISSAEVDKLLSARQLQSASFILEQIEHSLFDLYLHGQNLASKITTTDPQSVLESVRETIGLGLTPEWDRLPNRLAQIFAGDYAAGYYGYIWSQVYAADLFSEFQRAGVFNLTLAQELLEKWFSVGSVDTAQEKLRGFMRRDVSVKALHDCLGIQ